MELLVNGAATRSLPGTAPKNSGASYQTREQKQ
jgi:hypothetical protein